MTAVEAGAYCREVEAYLCRRNGGHLIRIVGPAFALVRDWAAAGVPLSIVQQAIDACAERREARRQALRPLRIEFCESEVKEQFDRWRRAVGPHVGGDAGEAPPPAPLAGHLVRAGEKLARAAGRLEHSDRFRGQLDAIVGAVAEVQTGSKGARGEQRAAWFARLTQIDEALLAAARAEAVLSGLSGELQAAAEGELSAWRTRMPAEAWRAAVSAASDRLLRARLDLPDLTP